ncbi:MAG: bifunctional glutamate N-acetyltransferase/amino-acid acetyltransferase ArgJ [Candidatus Omnitrophota bacterium]
MKKTTSGITKPKGFLANGISCGIKKSGKKDLALIYSTTLAKAAGVFTKNQIKAAPLLVTINHLKDHLAQAVIINSGNANCFTKKPGLNDAILTAKLTSKRLRVKAEDVLVASTGIIGKRLPMDKIKKGISVLADGLNRDGNNNAGSAIMTTDKARKSIAVSFKLGNKSVSIGAIAKGAGMIYPHLANYPSATMLCFITTDANISILTLNTALVNAVDKSFNSISVDGCTSTNDTVLILANGQAENKIIKKDTRDFKVFSEALNFVCLELAKKIVKDAEGATKFIQIEINGASTEREAKRAAFSIANSNLFKTACYGNNPNWGRIVAALGSSGVKIVESSLNFSFSPFKKKEIKVSVNLNRGKNRATVYTSDLTPEYVRINAQYS